MVPSSEDELRQAASGGDVTAINQLAGALFMRQEYGEAETWFEAAADLGDVMALTNLGAMLSERDPERAEEYWRRAAEAGYSVAMHNLAFVLANRSHEESMLWYLKAAQRGYVPSMCTLAILMKPMRLEEAELWATLAARADDAGSTLELDAALMLELGRLVEDVNPAAAEHWYARAAETRQSGTATEAGRAADPNPE